jgi:hypothetical protein
VQNQAVDQQVGSSAGIIGKLDKRVVRDGDDDDPRNLPDSEPSAQGPRRPERGGNKPGPAARNKLARASTPQQAAAPHRQAAPAQSPLARPGNDKQAVAGKPGPELTRRRRPLRSFQWLPIRGLPRLRSGRWPPGLPGLRESK